MAEDIDGISGYGTTLSGASTGNIGEVVKISHSGADSDDIDITTMNSEEGWKKFIAGLKDAKEFNLDLVYEMAEHELLMGAVGGANEVWTMTLPDDSTFVVDGHIKSVNLSVPHNDKITSSLTIRLSGKPVFHGGS